MVMVNTTTVDKLKTLEPEEVNQFLALAMVRAYLSYSE